MTDLEQSLLLDIPKLNADSQAFMRWILDRVIGVGMRDYGPWQAATDSRDMDREIADELADAVVYSGMQAVRRSLNKTRLVEQFKAAQHDHWESLVQNDVCTGCGNNISDAFADEPTTEFSVAGNSNASVTASLSQGGETVNALATKASGLHAPAVGSNPTPDTRLNKRDRACSECDVEVGEAHESDCAWVTVVPANSEVA